MYEHRALEQLSDFRRRLGVHEKLRSKSLLLRGGATLSMLTLRLQVLQRLIPALIKWDGSLNLDVRGANVNPMQLIARALRIPNVSSEAFFGLSHAWSQNHPKPLNDEETRRLLDEFETSLQDL